MAETDYDFWLFDLDGTLVDVEPAYAREVFDEVGARLGHSFTDREVELLWYGVGGAREERLASRGLDAETFWDVFHDVEEPLRRAEATYLYDDVEAFLAGLDCPTGVVTHCQPYLTDPLLDHLDIGDWFDAVVCCGDDVGWKPDPRPVERAMADLGVGHNGHSGVLAGDDPADIGAAWNTGLDAVHVERVDPHRRGQCVLGDHRIRTFDEFSVRDASPR
jgi:phosphoglycolate phosphatase